MLPNLKLCDMANYRIEFAKVQFMGFRVEVEYLKYKDKSIVMRSVRAGYSKFPEPINVFLSNFAHKGSYAKLKNELHWLVIEADKKM